MNMLKRSLIAAPIISSLLIFSGASVADITQATHKTSTKTNLSKVGFLDFKTLLFSSGTGDNLDGVFNQIKFIGPEMFRNTELRHGVLRKFKNRQSPIWRTSPVRSWEIRDPDVRNMDLNGKPSSASSELVDAILKDITDNFRNHGVSWQLSPAIGAGTVTYFNSATQKLVDQIEKLEDVTPVDFQSTHATQSAMNVLHPIPILLFGLGLVMIGLWRRWSRKKSPRPIRKIDPEACFDVIRRSPIQLPAKTI